MNELTLDKEKMKCGFNKDGSFHFGGVNINPGETYIDAVVRTTPARQRALTGLAFKLIFLRMKKEKGEQRWKIRIQLNYYGNVMQEQKWQLIPLMKY